MAHEIRIRGACFEVDRSFLDHFRQIGAGEEAFKALSELLPHSDNAEERRSIPTVQTPPELAVHTLTDHGLLDSAAPRLRNEIPDFLGGTVTSEWIAPLFANRPELLVFSVEADERHTLLLFSARTREPIQTHDLSNGSEYLSFLLDDKGRSYKYIGGRTGILTYMTDGTSLDTEYGPDSSLSYLLQVGKYYFFGIELEPLDDDVKELTFFRAGYPPIRLDKQLEKLYVSRESPPSGIASRLGQAPPTQVAAQSEPMLSTIDVTLDQDWIAPVDPTDGDGAIRIDQIELINGKTVLFLRVRSNSETDVDTPDPDDTDQDDTYLTDEMGRHYDFHGLEFRRIVRSNRDGTELYNNSRPVVVDHDVLRVGEVLLFRAIFDPLRKDTGVLTLHLDGFPPMRLHAKQ
jgi:hypothetical protein